MTTTGPSRKHLLIGAALIAVVTGVAYWPALRGGFIWDDKIYVTDYPLYLAPDGLYRIWFSTGQPEYYPISYTALWLEWRLWGRNPTGYHLVNLALHVAAALAIWAILRKLCISGAFLASLLFAVHPANVEAVAWIFQFRGLLAILFFLLSMLAYLRTEEGRGPRGEGRAFAGENRGLSSVGWYLLSLLAFALAMLSKGSVAILPVVLLLIAWWQRRRLSFGDLARTIPFFLVAIVLGVVNLWFQTHGFSDTIRSVTFSQRAAGAGAAVWFYLAKSLLPTHLVFVYPQWDVQTNSLVWWLPLVAAVVLSAVLWRQRNSRWGRSLLFTWLLFCVALLPVLGFADVGFMQFSLVSDHYQHIALIAVAAIVGAGFIQWRDNTAGPARLAALLLPATLVVLLTALAWQRSGLFSNAIHLYAATLESNPDCWEIHNSLAAALNQAGKYEPAVGECQQVLRLKPDSAEAHFNLAVALGKTHRIEESFQQFQQALKLRPARAVEVLCAQANILITSGRLDEAIENCQTALRMQPDCVDAHRYLGLALHAKGKLSSAIEHDRVALRLQPNNAEVLNNLANALLASGERQQAMECYRQALQLQFDSPETEYNLANLLVGAGNPKEALQHYQQALLLKPDYAEAEGNWGATLIQLRRSSEAIDHLQHAVQLDPNSADALNNLGIALFSIGKSQEAIAQFQESLKLNPENLAAHFNLGIALINAHRLQDAVEQFEQSLKLAPNNLSIYAELISVYSQLQQPEKAIAIIEKGLDLARSTGQTRAADQMQEWLSNLRAPQTPDAAGQSGVGRPTN